MWAVTTIRERTGGHIRTYLDPYIYVRLTHRRRGCSLRVITGEWQLSDAMSRITQLLAIALTGLLLVGTAGPALAHGWQTTVTVGDMELGVSSTPEDPIAGFETEFSARLSDETPGDAENRLDWGGVTNKTVEVHINGPGHVHDHTKATIPEDDAHFTWNYRFPTAGEYTMTVVAELEGEEYAFEFTRNVSLLPTEPRGAVTENHTDNVSAISENVEHMGEEVHEANEKIDSLEEKIDSLESTVQSLETDDHEDTQNAGLLGTSSTAMVGLLALVALIGAVAWRRY